MTYELGNQPYYVMKFIKFGLIYRTKAIQHLESNIQHHRSQSQRHKNHKSERHKITITTHNITTPNSPLTTHTANSTIQRGFVVMCEVTVLKPGFHWQGDQVE